MNLYRKKSALFQLKVSVKHTDSKKSKAPYHVIANAFEPFKLMGTVPCPQELLASWREVSVAVMFLSFSLLWRYFQNSNRSFRCTL